MVGGAGVLKADLPGIANDVNAILQVVVERDDVFPRAIVLRVDGNIQVLDLVLKVADLILERLGGIAGRLARAAVILEIVRVKRGSAVANLLIKIGEPAVVGAQLVVDVLLADGGGIAGVIVIIVKLVGVALDGHIVVIVVDLDLLDGCALGIVGVLVERSDHKECDQRDNHDEQYGDDADKQSVVVFGRSGSTGLRSGGRYGLLRRGAGWRRPLLRRADFGLGSGRGLMGGLHGHVRLRILLRLRGLAIIGYRRSAAGAKTLVVIQKLAAMGTKPGHDGSFHSMCWLDYKVVQVRLGRADPTGYVRMIMSRKPCRMRHNECGVLGVRRGRLSTAR